MLDVCLLGTGGTMPLPGRWLTSLVLRCNGRSLLIDAGEGTQIAAREAGCSFKNLDTICITHLHADHTAGLPGLLLTMGNMDRTEPVTVIGPNGIRRVMEAVKVIAPELAFDVRVTELEEGSARTISLGDWDVIAFPLRHTVPCFVYAGHGAWSRPTGGEAGLRHRYPPCQGTVQGSSGRRPSHL